eukprot:gnl/TRDRNA2_/TRDRNA2_94137_c1_seq1.p1 gnl/TRDRNA2_/TRDRNA2_94137_c1~~gnl/TRDRNA2_/TRDRNA2_94137_c1_seq1.p1  ORF type:complete len:357 (+),score=55.00 gnl/TRDRNA2_/TRDRNA2_94137_c1_seq1:86-1072(+)
MVIDLEVAGADQAAGKVVATKCSLPARACSHVAPAPYVSRTLKLPVGINLLRGYFWTSSHLAEIRSRYGRAVAAYLRPCPIVRRLVDATVAEARRSSRFVLGVHKRVCTPEVEQVQLSMRIPSAEEFIEAARLRLDKEGGPNGCTVLLASDDINAPIAFRAATRTGGRLSGARLVCRKHVRRTEGGRSPDGISNEVHRIPSSTQDAIDVLVDSFSLAQCDALVHIDSSIAMFAAVCNPKLDLCKVGGLLSPELVIEAGEPEHFVVTHAPFVFVRSQPTIGSPPIDEIPVDSLLTTSGRRAGRWVELDEGGWVLTDGAEVDLGPLAQRI